MIFLLHKLQSLTLWALTLDRWCKYHKLKVNNTKGFYQLKKEEIEQLIQEGDLKTYVCGNLQRLRGESKFQGQDPLGSPRSRKGKEHIGIGRDYPIHHTLNTIAQWLIMGEKYSTSTEEDTPNKLGP